MTRSVEPSNVAGVLKAPSSKSSLQRALACAALAPGVSEIAEATWSADSLAACSAARALGARIERGPDGASVRGIPPAAFSDPGMPGEAPLALPCGESGTALRMLTAVAALFPREIVLSGEGTLTRRPVGPVEEPLRALGAECATTGGFTPVRVRGPLRPGRVRVDGSGSSQFLTGLLIALPLARTPGSGGARGGAAPGSPDAASVIEVENLVSRGYVDLTLDVMRAFGVRAERSADYSEFRIPGGQTYGSASYRTEGDWSGAAFLLVAGALAARFEPLEVTGLDPASSQPDRAVLDALRTAGANLELAAGSIRVRAAPLRAFSFDATDRPDLFPPLAALAAFCEGTTALTGAGRLRAKESDRAAALAEELGKLGIRIEVEGDRMLVRGRGSGSAGRPGGEAGTSSPGGTATGEASVVDSRGDHRIAMAAAVAALAGAGPVEIRGAECVSKSYPAFFEDLAALGARVSGAVVR
ncbi:MAG TPA: 3-phosphoshikimate 1-carboxyvinyltransferase [Spirochaetia bacterium]|nr:3-phosphoshikimate 1-carboxyvinyltransferase [Spirochaetales bacterium]HRY78977.1 3-phosphoshikimate 1-carboxyvinyltransferase [Spirochaetia bacterium]HRZ88541.1 3-phosphoshikimate 1-carboxyvinyltransferase [Spirochaetia bacterium]